MLGKKKLLSVVCLMTLTAPVMAGEGSFGWLYTLDLQPKGTLEFEQKIDLTKGQAAGTYNLWKTKTGLEYGVTNDFQLTGYLNGYSVNANHNYTNCGSDPSPCTGGFGVPESASGHAFNKTQFEGASVEGVWRVLNPVLSPVGVGLYAEMSKGKFADALETRLLMQSNCLDDRLVLAVNVIAEMEKYKFAGTTPSKESMIDVLYGATYRFAPKWFAGIEGRFHNDFTGYNFDTHTQRANFIGPNLHYAEKDWWVTAAWRYQIGGKCFGDGVGECSDGKVWDSHGKNQFIVKVGVPFK